MAAMALAMLRGPMVKRRPVGGSCDPSSPGAAGPPAKSSCCSGFV